jgi:hypothetical protein
MRLNTLIIRSTVAPSAPFTSKMNSPTGDDLLVRLQTHAEREVSAMSNKQSVCPRFLLNHLSRD